MLRFLRDKDEKPWPINKTIDIFDAKFEFYFHGNVIFPVLMCKNHDSKVRQCPHTLIAFQPGVVFDSMKKNSARYECIRSSIHRRIDDAFEGNRPFYLSENSSGKNIVQYFGFDPEEINILL